MTTLRNALRAGEHPKGRGADPPGELVAFPTERSTAWGPTAWTVRR
jgi:hypothetical protein